MRDAPAGTGSPAVPVSVSRYLLPQEHLRLTLRQFPIMLVMPLAAVLGGLLAAIAASEIRGISAPARFAVWIIVVFLLMRLIAACISWPSYLIIITDKRLLVRSGFFNTAITVSPVDNFSAVSYRRSFVGRVIGYGTIIVSLNSGEDLTFDYMSYSEQIYLELTNFIADRDHQE